MKGQIRHITEVNSWTSNSIVRDGKTIRNATTQPRGTRGLAIQTDDISWIGRGSQIKFDHPQIRGMYKVDDIFDVTDGTQVFYVWTKKYQNTGETDEHGTPKDSRPGTYEKASSPVSTQVQPKTASPLGLQVQPKTASPLGLQVQQMQNQPYLTVPQEKVKAEQDSPSISGTKIFQYVKYGIGIVAATILFIVMKLKK
jgi:hypothetical protein